MVKISKIMIKILKKKVEESYEAKKCEEKIKNAMSANNNAALVSVSGV